MCWISTVQNVLSLTYFDWSIDWLIDWYFFAHVFQLHLWSSGWGARSLFPPGWGSHSGRHDIGYLFRCFYGMLCVYRSVFQDAFGCTSSRYIETFFKEKFSFLFRSLVCAGHTDQGDHLLSNRQWGHAGSSLLNQILSRSDYKLSFAALAVNQSINQSINRSNNPLQSQHNVESHKSSNQSMKWKTKNAPINRLIDWSTDQYMKTPFTLNVLCVFTDGRFIAVASVDRSIYIYQIMDGGSKCMKLGKCAGHSSAVLCLDWSTDSQYLRSNSDNFELIYCMSKFRVQLFLLPFRYLLCGVFTLISLKSGNPSTLKQITNAAMCRDVDWASCNCILEYGIAGVWSETVQALSVDCTQTDSRRVLAVGDDGGKVKLFSYPAMSLKVCNRVVDWLIDRSIDWLIVWFIDWLIVWWIDWLIERCIKINLTNPE